MTIVLPFTYVLIVVFALLLQVAVAMLSCTLLAPLMVDMVDERGQRIQLQHSRKDSGTRFKALWTSLLFQIWLYFVRKLTYKYQFHF